MNGKKFCLKRAVEAASVFVETIQTRDFSAFRSAFRGNERGRVQSSICTLWRCELIRDTNGILPTWEQTHDDKSNSDCMKHGSRLYDGKPIGTFTVVVTGDRFLYKMVRNIVGTIVAAARGYLEIDYIRDSIENQADSNDSMRRICATARGLSLCNVEFAESIEFIRTGVRRKDDDTVNYCDVAD
jgi:hypothetical protein